MTDLRSLRPSRIVAFPVTGQASSSTDMPTSPSLTLMQHLAASLPHASRTTLKQLLRHGQVAVDTLPVTRHDHPLQPGDIVRVNFTRPFRVFSHPRLAILYEDDDIIVVNKGYGLLSVGTGRPSEVTAWSLLRDYVKWDDPSAKIFVVHRLDRDTSGVMMFAKTPDAKLSMQRRWNNVVLSRTYMAVVEGTVTPPEGTVTSRLAENARHQMYSLPEDAPADAGRLAVTRYTTLRSNSRYSLLEVRLDTGRKNQIRVHLSELGHPIAGDRRYGATTSPLRRLALHAATLRFVHPTTQQLMDFTVPAPPGFARLAR